MYTYQFCSPQQPLAFGYKSHYILYTSLSMLRLWLLVECGMRWHNPMKRLEFLWLACKKGNMFQYISLNINYSIFPMTIIFFSYKLSSFTTQNIINSQFLTSYHRTISTFIKFPNPREEIEEIVLAHAWIWVPKDHCIQP